ncbi:fructose bisphosphate aldolase [Pseudonocardia sp. CA-142604]|uniref:fructose bisphosphate aldolase n=1 Tax=Pseudonocardia sp. CA-142604 TaxID=3240024 RepID=UPI003D943954
MNGEQYDRMRTGKGFIAALDQSGGSTPKALELYGVHESSYGTEHEMFDRVHEMRTRIITSPSFTGDQIIGAILFEDTMNRRVDGRDTAEYLWDVKGIVPFLKIDKGLQSEGNGVQEMKPIPDVEGLVAGAVEKGIFGTKMRSFIHRADDTGIGAVVDQQFELAHRILHGGLIPIIEPEIDINSQEKHKAEAMLRRAVAAHLDRLAPDQHVLLKLTLPEADNYYQEFVEHPRVVRVVALSGGYNRAEANERLARNHGVIASFSRALTEGLRIDQADEEFDAELKAAATSIEQASTT